METKHKAALAIIAIVLVGTGIWYFTQGGMSLAGTQDYDGRMVTFSAPASYTVNEYGLRTVIVGKATDEEFVPHVEIAEYRQDPDSTVPPSYSIFVQSQLIALCGSDAPDVTVKCSGTHNEPYETPDGADGEVITLKGTRTTTSTGAVEEFEFGPIYAFNLTIGANEHNPVIYRSLMIYPSFTTSLNGINVSNLQDQIIKTLVIKDELSEVKAPGRATIIPLPKQTPEPAPVPAP